MHPIREPGLIDTTSPTVIFTAGEGGASIDVFQLTNVSDDDVVVTVEITCGEATATLAHNFTITAEDNSISPVAGKLHLEEGDTITVTASAAEVVSFVVNGIGGFFDEL